MILTLYQHYDKIPSMKNKLSWAIAFNNNQYILFLDLSKRNIKPDAIIIKDGSVVLRQEKTFYPLEENIDTVSLIAHISKLSYIVVSDIDENGDISHDYSIPVCKD